MDQQHLLFLHLLETELSRTVLPAVGDSLAKQGAGAAIQELKRILVEETVVKTLRAEALLSYRQLLSSLKGAIDVALYARLEQAMSVEHTDNALIDDLLGEVVAMLQTGNAASLRLASQVVAIDSRVRKGKEKAWTELAKTPPPPADASFFTDLDDVQKFRLLEFLKQKFPGERNLQLASVKPLIGGFSKQTLFVDLQGNIELPDRLVMRRDPPYVTQGTSVAMEFPILQQVHAAGVAVPQPWAVDAGGDVLGTPFMLVSFVPGGIIGDFLVVHQPSRDAALNMARQIARLHELPIESLEDLLPGGRQSVRERMLGELGGLDAMWKMVKHQKAYAVQAALDWLRDNVDIADGQRKLVHRDVGVHNLLIEDHVIKAVLDWESVVIGTPAEDIAYSYYQIVQMMDWDEYVAEYQNASGVQLDKRQLDYYMLYASIRIAVGASSMVDPVYAGHRASLLQYFIGDYFVQTLINRVSAKLAELLEQST